MTPTPNTQDPVVAMLIFSAWVVLAFIVSLIWARYEAWAEKKRLIRERRDNLATRRWKQ